MANLADNPEYAFVKAGLKTQLIELRDGPNWNKLDDMRSWTSARGVKVHSGEIRMSGGGSAMLATKESFENFEFEADMKVEPNARMRIRYRRDPSSVVYSPFWRPMKRSTAAFMWANGIAIESGFTMAVISFGSTIGS